MYINNTPPGTVLGEKSTTSLATNSHIANFELIEPPPISPAYQSPKISSATPL